MTFETLSIAIGRLQAFLHVSYWYPVLARLLKRDEQIQTFKQQLITYKLPNTAPNVDNILHEAQKTQNEKASNQELRVILNRFCKNNIRLSIPLDMNQVVDLLKMFVDQSLAHIQVKFTDMKQLSDQVTNF